MTRSGISDEAIVAAIEKLGAEGVAPTYAELALELGFASTSSIRYRIVKLAQTGIIRALPGKPRAITAPRRAA